MMIKSINVCFNFNFPKELPLSKYRAAMAMQLKEGYPAIDLKDVALNRSLKYDEIILEMFPNCGCRDKIPLSEMPLESLTCPCGKSYYIKINKVKVKV